MPNHSIILVEKLVKVYPGGTRAVSGIDFSVAEGEFFGFLGPNGAGKSTTMKILSTLLKKSSGRLVVVGHDIDRDPVGVRKSIGFAMQEIGLDDLASGMDFLVLQGLLYGLSAGRARQRAGELLELVGLSDVGGRKVGTYSGGMRRRIDLVSALMHSPPLLFLDEPTTGLDPQSRLAIWDHLEELNKQGTTIFLTTQLMEEAERLCQRIAIMDQGQIVAEGSAEALRRNVGGDVISLTLDSVGLGEREAQLAKAGGLLQQCEYVSAVQVLDGGLTITVQDGSAAAPDLLRILTEHGISVTNLSVARPTLNDAFLKLTGREIRPQEARGDEVGTMMRPWLGLGRR